MAKDKSGKGEKSIPNKHLHARASFLYQAATYLSLQTNSQSPTEGPGAVIEASKTHTSAKVTRDASQDILAAVASPNGPPQSALALQLGSQLRAVSLKAQVRLSPDMKRSICKRCNTVLIPGRSSTSFIENKSRNGKKPWADVLVIQCNFCGGQKRFPVGSTRQLPKAKRLSKEKEKRASGPPNAEQGTQAAKETPQTQQHTG
jgi:ribonuclease P protein subunit RPR2